MNIQPAARISIKYVSVTFIAVVFTWILHEMAHWLTGTLMGYNMLMSLNKVFPASGYNAKIDYHLVSAAGPLITLLEAIIVFILIRRRKRIVLYPFLFACFYTRLLATFMSFHRLNDEARISSALGVGSFTLPLIVTGILFIMLYITNRRYQFPGAFNAINFGLTVLFSSMIILTDQFLKVRLI